MLARLQPFGRRHMVSVAFTTAVLTACGSSGSPDSRPSRDANPSEFCAAWQEASAAGQDKRLEKLLEHPPAELADAAAAVVEAKRPGDEEAPADAADEIFEWVELNCNPDVGEAGAEARDRRLAPPPESEIESLALCFAGTGLQFPESDGDGVVLYGDMSLPDPYTGSMLGVMWGSEESYGGDGEPTPVQVRGTDGVAAPITVFQQVVLEELGTVIAWQEDGLSVGLYGRFWDSSRIYELIAIAEQLEFVDGGFRLPPTALPAGYGAVFTGAPDALYFVIPVNTEYEVHYQAKNGDMGLLGLTGRIADPAEFEAFRFLTLDTARADLGGKPAIVGNAWFEGGPAVVTWQEPAGWWSDSSAPGCHSTPFRRPQLRLVSSRARSGPNWCRPGRTAPRSIRSR